jgi:hypothetical protein
MASAARRTEFIWTITATDESEAIMLTTKRKPATVGEILTEEFMQPMGLTQGALAEAMASSASTSTNCAATAGT